MARDGFALTSFTAMEAGNGDLPAEGVRGVGEVAAGAGVRVEDRTGLRFVVGPAEHVAAETGREDVEVGASKEGHRAPTPAVRRRHPDVGLRASRRPTHATG
jgi:hypothetical protein